MTEIDRRFIIPGNERRQAALKAAEATKGLVTGLEVHDKVEEDYEYVPPESPKDKDDAVKDGNIVGKESGKKKTPMEGSSLPPPKAVAKEAKPKLKVCREPSFTCGQRLARACELKQRP